MNAGGLEALVEVAAALFILTIAWAVTAAIDAGPVVRRPKNRKRARILCPRRRR